MKAGLLGRKLGHSLSPQIHRLFGDYDYRLYEREPDEVAAFLRTGFANGAFDFLNVTIPYKQTVFALCDELSPMARKLGNVNFVTRAPDGRLVGDNTDAFGVERLLDSVGAKVRGLNCAVLGAGGAAMTARAVLEGRGAARVTLVRRGETPAQDDALIVNATPVGMFPDVDGVRIDCAAYPNCRYVIDLVYNPSPTRLVREARACGQRAVDGLVMLIAQAYRAYCLSFGPDSSSLFLYGPPASGKSTLARRIAAATGKTLVDLDAEIVRAEGRGIPEIFATAGEAAFRALEKRELARIVRGANQVVALGGGALLDDACRRMVEAAGRLVVLDCPLATLATRLTGGDRPLSANVAKMEELMRRRAAHYASFPRHVRM
ncbi:MAG: shikimate kinase [Kiritimatiellia bacterium]